MPRMNTDLSITTIRARLGGQLRLAIRAGVWRCNGYPGSTLADAIEAALGDIAFICDGAIATRANMA